MPAKLMLTSSARLQKLAEALANASVIDAAKVKLIKHALCTGTYRIDAARVALKLLEFESALKRPPGRDRRPAVERGALAANVEQISPSSEGATLART